MRDPLTEKTEFLCPSCKDTGCWVCDPDWDEDEDFDSWIGDDEDEDVWG